MPARRPSGLAAAVSAAALFAALAAASPVAGQESPADDERFQIERVGEDVLRLNRQTGEVELCARSTPTFVCRTVVEPAPAPPVATQDTAGVAASAEILSENQALRLENARLKRRLAMIGALVAETEAEGASVPAISIPGSARREIDEALDVTTYAVRRFHDLFNTLTEDPRSN